MYAVKKLTVIGRVQNQESDVERITRENHARRMASEEAMAWEDFFEAKTQKEAKERNRKAWLHLAAFSSYASFGFALSMTAFCAAMNNLEGLSKSVAFLSLSLIASLICAERLTRC